MGFKIESVEIEGFKGFTLRQTIALAEAPTFIFGGNGSGKSSILDAIIWCLFGARGGEANVRNDFYQSGAGNCEVILHLKHDSGKWRIERRMRPMSGEAPYVLVDSKGERRNLEEVLPLTKLGHGPGATVIFADQEPGRRHIHDFEDFEELIASYLGLGLTKSLIRSLDEELIEQSDYFNRSLLKQYEKTTNNLQTAFTNLRLRINAVLKAPPWDTPNPPPEIDSNTRLKELVTEVITITKSSEDEVRGTDNPTDVLDTISTLVTQAETKSVLETLALVKQLEQKVNGVANLRQRLSEIVSQLSSVEERIKETNRRLTNLLGSNTVENLQAESSRLQSQNKIAAAHLEVAKRSLDVCQTEGFHSCPACGTALNPEALRGHLEQILSNIPNEIAAQQRRIQEVNAILVNVTTTRTTLNIYEATRQSHLREKVTVTTALAQEIESVFDENLGARVDVHLERLRTRIFELNKQHGQSQAVLAQLKKRIQNLRVEYSFHQLNAYHARLEKYRDSDEFRQLEGRLREFKDRLDRLETIIVAMKEMYAENLEGELPMISGEMTKVYQTLTQQKSYPEVKLKFEDAVSRTGDPEKKLVLFVGSEQDGWEDPQKKLNGQAKSAINLLPYFAFSNLDMLHHELDFLLIDDPSQSFDTSHITYMLGLLRNTSEHAQVIVATHEEDRFGPELSRLFKNYGVIKITHFDKPSGPTIQDHA